MKILSTKHTNVIISQNFERILKNPVQILPYLICVPCQTVAVPFAFSSWLFLGHLETLVLLTDVTAVTGTSCAAFQTILADSVYAESHQRHHTDHGKNRRPRREHFWRSKRIIIEKQILFRCYKLILHQQTSCYIAFAALKQESCLIQRMIIMSLSDQLFVTFLHFTRTPSHTYTTASPTHIHTQTHTHTNTHRHKLHNSTVIV